MTPSPFRSLALSFALATPAPAAVVVTEVGNNAPGSDSDNEYVALLNTGMSTVDLAGYDIADSLLEWDEIGMISLGAGQSLVISSGASEGDLETAWGRSIPDLAEFVVITGLAGFNNGDDDVNLRDDTDTIIYTFSYTGSLGDDDPPTAIATGTSGGSGGTSVTPFSTVVPEPGVALLGALGLLGLLRRRR